MWFWTPEIYASSVGNKTPFRRYAMRPIVNMPPEDRLTDTDNMHKKLAKIARVVLDISWRTDRQTDRLSQTYSSQYFTTAATGEVTRKSRQYYHP